MYTVVSTISWRERLRLRVRRDGRVRVSRAKRDERSRRVRGSEVIIKGHGSGPASILRPYNTDSIDSNLKALAGSASYYDYKRKY